MNRVLLFGISIGTLVLAGCHNDMWVQPKVKAQQGDVFFASQGLSPSGSRKPVAGTVAFEKARTDTAYYTGYVDGRLVKEFPIPVTKELIARGRERFEIFCSHCHGQTGDGTGMIAQRGFTLARPVATYHTDRLREMPVGHIFDVITNGYGTMYPFAGRIKPQDRWAIAAYIRALQLSQNATSANLDQATIDALKLGGTATTGPLFVSPATAPATVPQPVINGAPAQPGQAAPLEAQPVAGSAPAAPAPANPAPNTTQPAPAEATNQ